MKILWLTWKDRTHPTAGGAELVNEELAKRMVAEGHEVMFLVGSYKGGKKDVVSPDGYRIVRMGNRVFVYLRAWQYYRRHLVGWADVVIDEVNTMPFFAKLYVREPNILFVHQLCREIWFYQLPKALGWIGYLIEPVYLWMLSDRKVITVSDSTKKDLSRFGFNPERIEVITQGISVDPVEDLESVKKYPDPTLLSIGAIRAMKRTLDQVEAFELAKPHIPKLKLKMAGDASDTYGKRVLKRIAASPYAKDIEYWGRVSDARKIELMQKSHLVLQTAVKEGWGLTITEAAAQGTPAIVYDVDGLRDSVEDKETGRVVERTPKAAAEAIASVLGNADEYERLREGAWRRGREATFDVGHIAFGKVVVAA